MGDLTGEALLAWYFEEHLEFPFLHKDLEQRAVEALAGYGEELFAQVFGADEGCKHEYLKLRERGFDDPVSGTSEVLVSRLSGPTVCQPRAKR